MKIGNPEVMNRYKRQTPQKSRVLKERQFIFLSEIDSSQPVDNFNANS